MARNRHHCLICTFRIMSHPICEEFLPSALMRFYTDVEQTGSSNEFYEKFTTRYHISIIMKSMWESAVHKIAIISESKNGKQFIRKDMFGYY